MKNLKNQKGITLVALVVTIIVLLILAGVSLSLVAGGNGILKRASDSVTTNDKAKAKEAFVLEMANWQGEYYEEVYVNGKTTLGTLEAFYATKANDTEIDGGTYTATIEAATGEGATGYIVTIEKDGSEYVTGKIDANGKLTWDD